jgi:hypothetical protein
MASGDAGEILRQIADLKRTIDRMERDLREVKEKVAYIKTHGTG